MMTNKTEIETWLKNMYITNYAIRDDGVVDVDGNVIIAHRGSTRIPIQFGKVIGYFDCSHNKLSSLAGCPSSIGGHFDCSYNKLTSLVGGPDRVRGSAYCNYCRVTTLAGAPSKLGHDFSCFGAELKSHAIGLLLTGCVKLHAHGAWVSIINKYLGRPDDIFECQAELIENGYEAFAQL